MGEKYITTIRRFKEIDSMIRIGSKGKSYVKVSDMAKKLGVSDRTIQRDINFMCSSDIGLPIQYDEKTHTYFYTDEDLKHASFGDVLLNNSDKQIIMLARSLLLSLFSGTGDDYREAYKTFDTLIGKTDRAQGFFNYPMRESLLLALPEKNAWDDISKIIPHINKGECVYVRFIDEKSLSAGDGCPDYSDEYLIRPVYIVYAWSNWYLLYIDKTFSHNTADFKIIKTDLVYFARGASETENTRLPHIEYIDKKEYDFKKPVYVSCRIKTEYEYDYKNACEKEPFDCLNIEIYGNIQNKLNCAASPADGYSLKFEKDADNNLKLHSAANNSFELSQIGQDKMVIQIMDRMK